MLKASLIHPLLQSEDDERTFRMKISPVAIDTAIKTFEHKHNLSITVEEVVGDDKLLFTAKRADKNNIETPQITIRK